MFLFHLSLLTATAYSKRQLDRPLQIMHPRSQHPYHGLRLRYIWPPRCIMFSMRGTAGSPLQNDPICSVLTMFQAPHPMQPIRRKSSTPEPGPRDAATPPFQRAPSPNQIWTLPATGSSQEVLMRFHSPGRSSYVSSHFSRRAHSNGAADAKMGTIANSHRNWPGPAAAARQREQK